MEIQPIIITKEQTKGQEDFIGNWEKNFESSLKVIRKFKDDVRARPILAPTTEAKFEQYLTILILELTETLEQFKGKK